MTSNVFISHTAVYHPENQVNNSYYIDYFDKQDKDIRRMLEAFGRENRYVSDREEENSLTMAIEAAKLVLRQAGLTGADLDILVFSSGTPEYLAPSNAIHLHRALGGKENALVYDMNANCVGMVIAVDQVSKYMQSDSRMQRALIVGAEQMNRFSSRSNEVTLPNFGDAACAIIVERAENGLSGFIDSYMLTNSARSQVMAFPAKGLSRIYDASLSEDEKRIFWDTQDEGEASFLLAARSIETLLQRNHIEKQQIRKYFLSQLSQKNIERVRAELDEPHEKFIFVGDRFGYTGTSSPFIALNEAERQDMLSRGDLVVFWSVGAGSISSCVLLKY
ncbi:ketoacyl-ACP synthase III [Paenibacillus caui]|uniref:ketoacyl-ACP synthase III n=1 Tax=Paenibacillus caui TaxID=2873927 RepID=UPI001CA8CCB6|nr:ketoacyl-ACP synthase III [Paenibacillus caui]